MDKKRVSKKRENTIAKDTGGRRHAQSGALWWKKGDASDPEFMFEDKYTEENSFSVTTKILLKLEKEARDVDKLPVLVVGLGLSPSDKGDNYAIVRTKDCNVDMDLLKYVLTETYLTSKSYKITRDKLKLLRRMSYRFCLRFVLSSGDYLVIPWEEFLYIKGKIVKGEKV